MSDNMNSAALVPLAETMELGTVLAKSGFFADSTQAAQAVVKVLAGREIGVGPIAAMTGIHIIKGKPAIGANLMAATIKNSRRYNYRIRQHDETICAIEFFERTGDKWESVGTSTFTIADARKAGTQNIDKFARNMLFARAMSNGARWFCPDIFGGAPIYTPEEMGAPVDGDGDVIEGSVRVVQPEPQTQPPAKPNGTNGTPKPQAQPSAHWIDDADTRKRFWAFASQNGIDGPTVHQVLGVEHVNEFTGTAQDARRLLDKYLSDRYDQEQPQTEQQPA